MRSQLFLCFKITFSFIIVIFLVSCLRKKSKRSVLLVSLDGFRSEYLLRGLTPTLKTMSDHGVYADYLIPVFPSITFPNHYSIATGLYPGSHGIVSNIFFDSVLNETYSYTNHTNNKQSKWWKGEPIWKTVQRLGQSAAVIMWPGSEAILPDFLIPYGSMDINKKCDQILSWHESYDIHLYMMYVPDVDGAGHIYGVESAQVIVITN
jgi:predicted AlkP superfamily pyrophosphatase or phosphodiesterase